MTSPVNPSLYHILSAWCSDLECMHALGFRLHVSVLHGLMCNLSSFDIGICWIIIFIIQFYCPFMVLGLSLLPLHTVHYTE